MGLNPGAVGWESQMNPLCYGRLPRLGGKIVPNERFVALAELALNKFVTLKWAIFLNGPYPASFSFIFVFSNKHYKFYNN